MLFVYGTLLQGEERGSFLNKWKLLDAFEIPGILYDTGLGYPAADFSDKSNAVFGELYSYEEDDICEVLENLDIVEGVDENLYRRVNLNLGKYEFCAYEIAAELNKIKSNFNVIDGGNWRHAGSFLHNNLSSFAISFESAQSLRYNLFPGDNSTEFVYLKGKIPILVVSCHATSHIREGRLKTHEKYTGAINVILNSISGVHSLYTVYASESDSNYCEATALKERIAQIVERYQIKFVLDIHGTGSYRKFDLYPGIGSEGEFINGNAFLMSTLERVLQKNNIKLGGTHVFPAYRQHTVSRFVNSELKTPAMQLEINKKYRNPDSDSRSFENLINSLDEYIENVLKNI